MKFILALSIVALAAVGCGQNHGNQDRPQSTTPVSDSGATKASLEAALNSIPGQSPTDSATLIASLGEEGQATPPSDVNALRNQIGVQQNLLYQEKAAYDQAIRDRNNVVHLGPQFMDTAAYGISTGALSWDFLRRQGYLRKADGTVRADLPETVAASSATESAVSSTAATSALRQAGPMIGRSVEGVSAVVLGIFFVGKTLQFGKDVVVRFSDTNAIRFHRAKVVEAEKNLENAKANLAAVYFPDSTGSSNQ